MSKVIYPATFEDDGGTILVLFPGIPGIATVGKDLQEAYAMAEEALGTMLEDMEELPPVQTIQQIQTEFPHKAVALISLDLLAFKRKHNKKTVKKNTSIPAWLNELAEQQHINFSQTLTEALKQKLNIE